MGWVSRVKGKSQYSSLPKTKTLSLRKTKTLSLRKTKTPSLRKTPKRHCERSEAISMASTLPGRDCRGTACLAMTLGIISCLAMTVCII